jgi:hypothetical protein
MSGTGESRFVRWTSSYKAPATHASGDIIANGPRLPPHAIDFPSLHKHASLRAPECTTRGRFVVECDFLTRNVRQGIPTRCVYMDAAPGSHIPLLAMMFPGVSFMLYGEALVPGSDEVNEHRGYATPVLVRIPNVEVNPIAFTEIQARFVRTHFSDWDILFIADTIPRGTDEEGRFFAMQIENTVGHELEARAALFSYAPCTPHGDRVGPSAFRMCRGIPRFLPWTGTEITRGVMECSGSYRFSTIAFERNTVRDRLAWVRHVLRARVLEKIHTHPIQTRSRPSTASQTQASTRTTSTRPWGATSAVRTPHPSLCHTPNSPTASFAYRVCPDSSESSLKWDADCVQWKRLLSTVPAPVPATCPPTAKPGRSERSTSCRTTRSSELLIGGGRNAETRPRCRWLPWTGCL